MLIHFPIALFLVGVAFDFASQFAKSSATLASAAYINFWVAAAFTVPAVATGLVAWQWALEGQKLNGILREHLVMACFSTVLIWVVLWIHRAVRRAPGRKLPAYRLPIEALAALAIMVTGHLGGFLSGVNSPM